MNFADVVQLTDRRSVAVVLLGVYGVFQRLQHGVICRQIPKHSGIPWGTKVMEGLRLGATEGQKTE